SATYSRRTSCSTKCCFSSSVGRPKEATKMKTSEHHSPDSHAATAGRRPPRRRFGTVVAALAAGAFLAGSAAPSWAEDVVRVGVIGEFSGAFAIYGQQSRRAIELFMKEHGDKVGS